MMRKYFLLVVICGAALSTMGQESHLYIKAGANLSNVTISDNGKYDEANRLVSFHAGLGADLPLTKFFSVQPSLLFTGKGTKTKSGSNSGSNPTYFTATSNPYYIELPVNFVAKIPLAMDESNFFIGAGPYIAMGIAGKNKTEGKVLGTSFNKTSDIKFSNDDPGTTNYEEGAGFGIIKRFDYGLNGTAGFQLNSILLSANYGYGLAKLASGANNNNNNNKYRVISFTLGVRL